MAGDARLCSKVYCSVHMSCATTVLYQLLSTVYISVCTLVESVTLPYLPGICLLSSLSGFFIACVLKSCQAACRDIRSECPLVAQCSLVIQSAHPPCNVETNTMLSLSFNSYDPSPSNSQSASLIRTRIPGLLGMVSATIFETAIVVFCCISQTNRL